MADCSLNFCIWPSRANRGLVSKGLRLLILIWWRLECSLSKTCSTLVRVGSGVTTLSSLIKLTQPSLSESVMAKTWLKI